MSGLLGIAQKFENGGLAMPSPPQVRALPKVMREWGAMAMHERSDPEPWQSFIERIDPANPARLGRKDLRRLASEIWDYPSLEEFVVGLVDHCARLAKRTLDRRLARAYWNRFKPGLAMFSYLGNYCASRESSLGLPWTELSAAIPLWHCEHGPKALGAVLLDTESRDAILDRAKLDMRDMQGGFVEAAFGALLLERSQRSIKNSSESALRNEGENISQLAEGLGDGALKGNAGLISYALLRPWMDRQSSGEYKDHIRAFLIKHFGDPRTGSNQWKSRASALQTKYQLSDADEAFRVLNRWLTERSVELFFEIIASTTERKDHWKARRAFWNAYLANGTISEAWCILGTQAARQANSIDGITLNDFGKVDGGGVDPSHSALLMKIGDLVIADWSHMGAVRFWKNPNCPDLYNKNYSGKNLYRSWTNSYARSNHLPINSMSHVGRWYKKFADLIHQETGIRYPGPKPADLWGW